MSDNRCLFVFTQDLRLHDNVALNSLLRHAQSVQHGGRSNQQTPSLAFAYVFDEQWFTPRCYQQQSMGPHKLSFLLQSLADLQQQLSVLGHSLQLYFGNPVAVVTQLAEQNRINALGYSKSVGWDERQSWQQIGKNLPDVTLLAQWNNGLFNQQQMTPYIDAMSSFSQFRRKVEKAKLAVELPCDTFNGISPHPITLVSQYETDFSQFQAPSSVIFSGGEKAANKHIEHYFSSHYASDYKQTRNALDGFEHSTKFSPFLAIGNVSARALWSQLKQYERIHGANESTYWIGFELLWREYFHWLAWQHGPQLFHFKGQATVKPLTSFFPERFKKWCLGNTPYPLVNACMKQLNTTGYMSNRGRQIVASCLVNELGLDWRYGAAYFEQQLIDYDVASNWGNWQYIAGVGVDPSGGRHFNIEKQTSMYDPQHVFIRHWLGEQWQQELALNLDSLDAVDWPQEHQEAG
ncbi:DASH family cryptochrome [Shewanella goraebulensis]|uniref:DASH family cryptochrome n=1 Tax=Shewanella goraebulensis TaxID=3050637 RepID=UPI002550A0F5|nr:DASH family cryptochrome [Shewanella goraebulensis]